MFKVEKNVPIPKSKQGRGRPRDGEAFTNQLETTLRQLDPKESFEVSEKKRGTLNWKIGNVSSDTNRKFILRKQDNGKIRVWRVE